VYSDPIILSGYHYNLLKYPVPETDILIRISAEGVIRNQIRRIGVYPYHITAQNPYPDNPCYWVGMAADVVSYVRNCDSCARQRVRPLARRSPLTLFPANMPFQDIAVDL